MAFDESLLAPIDGEHPAGSSLRYTSLYDQIHQARREEDDLPRGEWEKPRKISDVDEVIRLTHHALAHASKDLQLAAWWTEAMLRRVGLGGLTDGLALTAGLIERYWEVLHPEIEDGDTELRAAPLEWMDLKLADQVLRVPLTVGRHDWYSYREARSRRHDADEYPQGEGQARDTALVTAEMFDSSVRGTRTAFYESLGTDLAAARAALNQLVAACGNHAFSGPTPTFPELTRALDNVEQVVSSILESRRREDVAVSQQTPGLPAPPLALAAIIEQAELRRAADRTEPLPYLLLRAVQWGTLTTAAVAGGSLEAPSAEARTRVAAAQANGDWTELLEIAEAELARPSGRGWLDLQRYASSACEGLGGAYTSVREAIGVETAALLARIPALLTATLADGTATADAATQEWIERLGGLVGGARPATADSSARSRFLSRLQLAKECVGNGQSRVGCAVAEELLEEMDLRHLEQWESPELLLEPLLILFESTTDPARRRLLFNRICRIDPRVAIARKLDPDA